MRLAAVPLIDVRGYPIWVKFCRMNRRAKSTIWCEYCLIESAMRIEKEAKLAFIRKQFVYK